MTVKINKEAAGLPPVEKVDAAIEERDLKIIECQ